MDNLTRYLPFIGRLLIGGVFIVAGAGKLSQQAGITAAIAHAGLPFASLGYYVALLIELGSGLLLILGWYTRPVALVLAGWCIVLAILFHSNFADQNMMIHFIKNVMIAGGLLQIVYFGSGAISLDARAARTTSPLPAAINQ